MSLFSLKKNKFMYRLLGVVNFYDYEWIKKLYQKVFISSSHRPQYYLELVNRCNADCIFCTYPIIKDLGKPLVSMNDALFDQAITIIKQEKRSNISLTPTTGEIFMHKNWDKYINKILKLDFVKNVQFYSNAALLNEKNRNKFFELPFLNKMKIDFSTGGIDPQTYKTLFGHDLFAKVESNINYFLLELKKRKLKIPVGIDIKLLSNQKLKPRQCRAVYNKYNYNYVLIKLRRKYDDLGGNVNNHEIDLFDTSNMNKRNPCNYLNDIRFAANGEIWLCGCVISELPGQNELKIGNMNENLNISEINLKKNKIINDWKKHNKIPTNCKNCSWYNS